MPAPTLTTPIYSGPTEKVPLSVVRDNMISLGTEIVNGLNEGSNIKRVLELRRKYDAYAAANPELVASASRAAANTIALGMQDEDPNYPKLLMLSPDGISRQLARTGQRYDFENDVNNPANLMVSYNLEESMAKKVISAQLGQYKSDADRKESESYLRAFTTLKTDATLPPSAIGPALKNAVDLSRPGSVLESLGEHAVPVYAAAVATGVPVGKLKTVVDNYILAAAPEMGKGDTLMTEERVKALAVQGLRGLAASKLPAAKMPLAIEALEDTTGWAPKNVAEIKERLNRTVEWAKADTTDEVVEAYSLSRPAGEQLDASTKRQLAKDARILSRSAKGIGWPTDSVEYKEAASRVSAAMGTAGGSLSDSPNEAVILPRYKRASGGRSPDESQKEIIKSNWNTWNTLQQEDKKYTGIKLKELPNTGMTLGDMVVAVTPDNTGKYDPNALLSAGDALAKLAASGELSPAQKQVAYELEAGVRTLADDAAPKVKDGRSQVLSVYSRKMGVSQETADVVLGDNVDKLANEIAKQYSISALTVHNPISQVRRYLTTGGGGEYDKHALLKDLASRKVEGLDKSLAQLSLIPAGSITKGADFREWVAPLKQQILNGLDDGTFSADPTTLAISFVGKKTKSDPEKPIMAGGVDIRNNVYGALVRVVGEGDVSQYERDVRSYANHVTERRKFDDNWESQRLGVPPEAVYTDVLDAGAPTRAYTSTYYQSKLLGLSNEEAAQQAVMMRQQIAEKRAETERMQVLARIKSAERRDTLKEQDQEFKHASTTLGLKVKDEANASKITGAYTRQVPE